MVNFVYSSIKRFVRIRFLCGTMRFVDLVPYSISGCTLRIQNPDTVLNFIGVDQSIEARLPCKII
jgi:hypothetical protein